MSQLERFGISMDADLLERFDAHIQQAGYANRSEAIRDLVREALLQEQTRDANTQVIGTVTIMYDHHARQLEDRLTDLQHDHHETIRCTTHVHLDAHNCVEVIVLGGTAAEVTGIANSLISMRGVKHGKLVITAPQHS